MARSVHLLGGIPGSSAREAMESALSRLPAHLRTLSDGEAGARSWWIRAVMDRLYEHPDTRFGVHLCLGDMNHKALGRMREVRPLVLLSNELPRQWPAGRPLEYIHAPFAAAEEPPTFKETFYAPLRDPDLPAEIRFVAGCVHESLGLEQQRRLLRLIEELAGRQRDVAAACGLSRRPDVAQAWQMDKSAALVES
jgi:hypothetical protein